MENNPNSFPGPEELVSPYDSVLASPHRQPR